MATGTVSPSRFEGMRGPIGCLWSLPDGRLLAISHDGAMSMFDRCRPTARTTNRSGRRKSTRTSSLQPNSDLALNHLLAPDPQGLRLWNIDPSTWPAVACQRAGRNLTPDEWTRYMPADEPYRSTCPQFPAG